jgi:membrane-associated protease RseP (regulator of RpoE activity)
MLGFYVGGLVDENLQKRLGLSVEYGMHVSGLLEGMGAERSGVKKDDVISVIEGKEIRLFQDIGEAIRGKKGGDVISTVIYRGAEKNEMEVELSKRPVPEFPPGPEALADLGRATYKDVLKTLKETLSDVTKKEASHKPSEGEWSVMQVLAHLLISERWTHNALALHPEGRKLPSFPGSGRLVDAVAETYSVKTLLKEIKNSVKLNVNLWKGLPEAYTANKGSYFLLAQNFEQGIRMHFDEHTAQIKAALKSARQQAAEPVPV